MRAARLDDRPALLELWREADELHARLLPGLFRGAQHKAWASATEDCLRDAIRDSHQGLFVAEGTDGAVRGACHVQVYDTPDSVSLVQSRRAQVESLVVAEPWRRRGCARALMAGCEAWAREHGATQLFLTVWAGNEEAERFYEELGYSRVSQVLAIDL